MTIRPAVNLSASWCVCRVQLWYPQRACQALRL